MPKDDAHIQEQLEALEEERGVVKEQYRAGDLSEKDYEIFIAKNDFLIAQIKDRAEAGQDKNRQRVYERARDCFGD